VARRAGGPPGSQAAELEDGISLGLAPQPELEVAGPGGVAVTRLSSWWNHLHCRRCGHTFRHGDTVQVSQPDRTVVHLVPGLGCGAASTAGSGAAAEQVAMFRDGLMSSWPPGPELRVRRLTADDWRLPSGPDDRREANVCLHCGHTFRAGEYVVICPCRPAVAAGPGRPAGAAACGRAVHRDPAAGLLCWESWQPAGTVTVCPVTQIQVDQR
jgi:hypothetical protein